MKRKISLLLIVVMCLTTLSTSGAGTLSRVPVTYDQLHNLVLENNQTIKSNNLALKIIKNPPGVSEAQDALWTASQGLASLSSTVNSSMLAVQGLISGIDQDTTVADATVYSSLYVALLSGNMAISSLKSDIDSQMYSLNPTSDEDMESTIKQFESIEQQLIWASQSLYMAYLGLDITIEELEMTKNSLQNTITSLEKRFALGQISELDLLNVKVNLITINSTLDTLAYEQEKLLYDLNILLGNNYSDTINLSHDITPDISYLSDINFEEDFKQVLENNYNYYTASESVDDASDTHDNLDSTASQNNYDMAKINLQIQEQSLKSSFNKIYLQIAEKQRLISVEEQILENKALNIQAQELKLSHGTISQDEYNATVAEYDTQALKIKTAKYNLFIAIEQYKWALNGMITG